MSSDEILTGRYASCVSDLSDEELTRIATGWDAIYYRPDDDEFFVMAYLESVPQAWRELRAVIVQCDDVCGGAPFPGVTSWNDIVGADADDEMWPELAIEKHFTMIGQLARANFISSAAEDIAHALEVIKIEKENEKIKAKEAEAVDP